MATPLSRLGTLSLDRCDAIFDGLLEGLSKLHADGRAHAGLHPDRILVGDDDSVRLGGRRADPRYRAPELGPVGTPDFRADLYSLGLVAWELYAGRPACPDGTVHQARAWHRKQGPWPLHKLRREVPEWLGDFLSKLYERDPRFRPSDARVALSRFRQAQREPPVVLKLGADHGPGRWNLVRRFVKPSGDDGPADGPSWGLGAHVLRVARNTLAVVLLVLLALKFFPELGEVALAQDARTDTDGDGVVDGLDRCRETPEDRDGDRDMDGCPESGPVIALGASDGTTCAVRTSGEISCWGDPLGGDVPEGPFDEVAVGGGWACALDPRGMASCWGRRASEPPEQRLVSLSMRGGSACGLDGDGGVWCWGADAGVLAQRSEPMGSLGTGLCAVDGWGGAVCATSVPVDDTFAQVAGSSDWAACGRTRAGVRCWGRSAPRDREGAYVDLAVGRGFACALDEERKPSCWGSAPDGLPAAGMLQLVAGDDHACGIRLDGRVMCWGEAGDVPEELVARASRS